MSFQYTVQGFELTILEHESPPITTRPGLPPPNYCRLFSLVTLMTSRIIYFCIYQIIFPQLPIDDDS